MRTSHVYWSEWARSLQSRGLGDLTAWFLEAAAPLAPVGAQLLYFGRPFVPGEGVLALAHLLEDRDETLAFVDLLRKDVSA